MLKKKPWNLVVIRRSLLERLTIDTLISNHLNNELKLRKDLQVAYANILRNILLWVLWGNGH